MSFQVRERVPLKQGLKLVDVKLVASGLIVRERVPLKQGLKLDRVKGIVKIGRR